MGARIDLEDFGVYRLLSIKGVEVNMSLEKSIDRLRVEMADLDKVIAIFETLSGRLTTRTCTSAPNRRNPKTGRRKCSSAASRGNLRLVV